MSLPVPARAYITPMHPPTPLERAFALAVTGDYAGVGEIRDQLKAEGYETVQLSGGPLVKQLRGICQRARKKHDA